MNTYTQHCLKTWPQYFEHLWVGMKKFEVRKNDRGFKVGDYLILQEWDPVTELYSGRVVSARVTYIHHGEPLPRPLCVMSLDEMQNLEFPKECADDDHDTDND